MSSLTSKVILIAMFAVPVTPLFADLQSLALGGGYTAYDCGSSGSVDYQSCLNAMALGESQFLASYIPTGSPLPANWESLLPALPTPNDHYVITAASPDGLSALISAFLQELDDTTEPEYLWHDDIFTTSALYRSGIEIYTGSRTHIAINDQGFLAATQGDTQHAYVQAVGYVDRYLYSSLGWFLSPSPAPPILNDDDQVLFSGYTFSGNDYVNEYILVDPAGAPIPGVPEPGSLGLLATALALVISLRRKTAAR